MNFVSEILIQVFRKPKPQAEAITLQVHNEGKGIAGGGYTKEIAETKIAHSISAARKLGYPFLLEAEPE